MHSTYVQKEIEECGVDSFTEWFAVIWIMLIRQLFMETDAFNFTSWRT